MREDTNEVSANEMLLIFESNPVNEGLARVTAASFCTQLNPTLEEIADLKTAVSEAVTNCIIPVSYTHLISALAGKYP